MRRGILFVALADIFGAFLVIVFVLFAIAFASIKTDEQHGNVTLPTQMLVTMGWNPKSDTDLDLWAKGPVGQVVGYPMKDNGYMHLDRDDLGTQNDTIIVNGQQQVIEQNVENISINRLIPGEYIFNVHFYRGSAPMENPTLTVVQLAPYRVIFKGTLAVTFLQERTFVSFVVNPDGSIGDIRTDVDVPIRSLVP